MCIILNPFTSGLLDTWLNWFIPSRTWTPNVLKNASSTDRTDHICSKHYLTFVSLWSLRRRDLRRKRNFLFRYRKTHQKLHHPANAGRPPGYAATRWNHALRKAGSRVAAYHGLPGWALRQTKHRDCRYNASLISRMEKGQAGRSWSAPQAMQTGRTRRKLMLRRGWREPGHGQTRSRARQRLRRQPPASGRPETGSSGLPWRVRLVRAGVEAAVGSGDVAVTGCQWDGPVYDQFGRWITTSPPSAVTVASTQHASASKVVHSSSETSMGAVGFGWMARPVANANNLSCSSRVMHDWSTTPSSSRRYHCSKLFGLMNLDMVFWCFCFSRCGVDGCVWTAHDDDNHWPRGYRKRQGRLILRPLLLLTGDSWYLPVAEGSASDVSVWLTAVVCSESVVFSLAGDAASWRSFRISRG